jgi:hypothetical protein
VVCVGPSLSHGEARMRLRIPALLLPPVKRGDLERLPETVEAVAIVDGVFHQQLAVSVREILALLARGVRVIGASSMGALRAVELREHGMEGVGAVYAMYLAGEIASDAEVALTFHPDTYAPLSEPLVNIRHLVARAEEDGAVDATSAALLLDAACAIHYTGLTHRELLRRAASLLPAMQLHSFEVYVAANAARLDLKRRDAVALIDALNQRDLGGAGYAAGA